MSTANASYTKVGWDELPNNVKVSRPGTYRHPWRTDVQTPGSYESRDYDNVLGCEHIAFCLDRIAPGQSGMHHRHAQAEEIHLLIKGSCQMMVGDEIVDAKELDAIWVPPHVDRSFFNNSDEDAWWIVMGAPVDEFREEGLEMFRAANGY